MSFLRTAAVAALAGTSGRNLGTDYDQVVECKDDICGDKIIPGVTLTDASGVPALFADSTAMAEGDTAFEVTMSDNTIPGLFNNDDQTKMYVSDKDIKVQVHLRTSEGYDHNEHQCKLSVTMTPTESNSETPGQTSATFTKNHGLPTIDDVTALSTIHGKKEYLEVTIPTPTKESGLASNSLGDIVADIKMQLTCKDPAKKLNDATIPLLTSGGKNAFQAKYTYVRDADKDERWTWEAFDDDAGAASGLSKAEITEEHKHQSRTVTVEGKSIVRGRKGAPILFPKGQWATYNSAASDGDSEDPNGKIGYKGTLTCAVVAAPQGEAEGELFKGYPGFVTNWYESKNQISSGAFSYDAGVDANCVKGVCDGRMHRAEEKAGTDGFSFDTALGFEAPYLEYFKAAPQISCTTSDGLAGTPQKDITGIAASKGKGDGADHYSIGKFNTEFTADGFKLSTNPSEAKLAAKEGGDYGDQFFSKGGNSKIFGKTQLFEYTIKDDYWKHVSDGYNFNVYVQYPVGGGKSIQHMTEFEQADAATFFYKAGTDASKVKKTIDGFIANVDGATVTRPTLYGETRKHYQVARNKEALHTRDDQVAFRRDSSNIRITLDFKSDGETVEHTGDPGIKTDSDGNTVNFDGPDERAWVVGNIALSGKSFTLADTNVIGYINDVDGNNKESTFLKIYADGNADELFISSSSSDASAKCGETSPWCTMTGITTRTSPDGTKSEPFLCKASSVTATRFITKDTLDNRTVTTALKQSVSKTYTRAKADEPAEDASTKNKWFTDAVVPDSFFGGKNALVDGTEFAEKGYPFLMKSKVLGNNVGLQFIADDTNPLEFNCHEQKASSKMFQAEYDSPCGDATELKHTMYTKVQVHYHFLNEKRNEKSFLTQLVSDVTVNQKEFITEWQLQRKDTALKFKVKSKHGIPAEHFDSDGFTFTSKYMGQGKAIATTCTGSAGNYACALTVPADATHDETQLAHGEKCCKKDERDVSCTGKDGKVVPECPYVQITATAKTWDGTNCHGKAQKTSLLFPSKTPMDPKKPNVPGTQETYKVYLSLVGSDEVYDGAVTVKNIGADDNVQDIASVATQNDLVPGADGLYRTELKIPGGVVQPVLKGKQYAIEFDKHTASGDYVIQSKGQDLLLCDKQTFSDNKCKDATTSLTKGYTLTLEQASKTTVYVRMASDAEPCKNKFKGEDAYDGTFNFTIRRKKSNGDLELPHLYHVPVQCGTPQLHAIAWDDTQQAGSAWYKKTYRVQLTGSSLVKDATQLLIEKTADEHNVVRSELSFPDAEIERDGEGRLWQTLDEVQFSQLCTGSSEAATATVTAKDFSLESEDSGSIRFDCPAEPLDLVYRSRVKISSSDNDDLSTVKPDAIEGDVLTIESLHLGRGPGFDGQDDVPVEIVTDGVKFVEGFEISSIARDTPPVKIPPVKIHIDRDECTESLIVVKIQSKITKDEEGGLKTVQLRVPCPRATLELYAKGKLVQRDQLLTPSADEPGDRPVVRFEKMYLGHRDSELADKQVTLSTASSPADAEEVEFANDQIGDEPTDSVGFRFTKGGADCDFVTVTMTSKRYEYQYSKDGAGAVTEDVTFYMACPKATLQLFQGMAPLGVEIVGNPILVGKETAESNVVTFADRQGLYLKNRDDQLAEKFKEVKIEGTANAGGDSVAFVYDYGIGDDFDTERQPVGIEFVPAKGATSLTCSFMDIAISAQRTDEEEAETVQFRMKCPHTELELYVGDKKVEEGDLLKPDQEHDDPNGPGAVVHFGGMRLHHRDFVTMNDADKKVGISWKTFPEGASEGLVFVPDNELGDIGGVAMIFKNAGANCDFIEITFEANHYKYLNPANGELLVVGGKVVTFYMACPNTQLRLFQGKKEVQQNALIAADTFHGTIVRFKSLYLGNRDDQLAGDDKEVKIEGTANAGDDEVAFEYDYGIGDDFDTERQPVGIEFLPAKGATSLTCNFMQITISARRTRLETLETVSFRVQCPRVKDVDAKVDTLSLDYTIDALTFGLSEASIQLPKNPKSSDARPLTTKAVGFTSGGKCDAPSIPEDLKFEDIGEKKHAQCDLQDAIGQVKAYKSASQMMSVIEDCGGKMNWNEQIAGVETITSTGYVTRVYQRQHPFHDKKFDYHCGVSTVSLEVVRSATKTTTVAVQSAPAVDFGVHVARAEFTTTGCKKQGEQRLEADIDTVYKDTKNSPPGEYLTAGLHLQHMSASPGKDAKFKQVGSDGTSQLQYQSQCASGDALKELEKVGITFELVRKHLGLVHTGKASVGLEVKLEEDEEGAIAKIDVDKDVLVTQTCASGDGKGNYAPCGAKGAAIPATDDLKLAISITGEEKTAFAHEYGKPQYKIGESGTYALVAGLTSEYVTQRGEPLVSKDNAVVALRALPFAGETAVYIQWKVSRVEIKTRLRRLLTVTYALGADGSVTKSSSFSVAPALRESSGASAVGDQTVELITDKELPEGTERTTEVLKEKQDKDEGLEGPMVGMIVAVSVLGVGVIALLVIVAVQGRKKDDDTPAVAMSSEQGTNLLWKTNRFTGEAF